MINKNCLHMKAVVKFLYQNSLKDYTMRMKYLIRG